MVCTINKLTLKIIVCTDSGVVVVVEELKSHSWRKDYV